MRKNKDTHIDQAMIRLGKLDTQKLKTSKYSHAQAIAITGVSSDVLQAWAKRGFLVHTTADENRKKLRGHRRTYSIVDLLVITVMGQLAACGTPLVFAAAYSVCTLDLLIQTWEFRLALERAGQPYSNTFLVIYEANGEFKGDLYDSFAFGPTSPQPQTLEAFVLALGSPRATLIDINSILTRFTHLIASEKDGPHK